MAGSFKRVACMALSVIMTASLFTACGSGKQGAKETKGTSGDQADTQPISTYPIVDKPLTLNYWTTIHVNATAYIRDFNENEAYQEMEKRTGIHINFTHPANGQENESFNLMIASGDLPDIITGAARYKGGIMKGVDDKVFFDATPLLPKYAPDYYKLINSDKEIKREVSYDNGAVPAFVQIKPVSDPPWRRLNTRKDLLNEFGLDIPRTIADWEAVFKNMKDKKGIQNPFILSQDGQEELLMGAYGLINGFYLKDGKAVDYGQIQPAFKDYLALMNKWYSYGYIAKDFPTIKESQYLSFYGSGRAGTIIISVGNAYDTAKAAGLESTPAPFPRLNANDVLHWKGPDWPTSGSETVVTEQSKYKNESIRWLNYPYTKEGSMLFNYGVEGKTYVMENGKPVYTDYMKNNPKIPVPNTNYIFKVHFAPKLTASDLECQPPLPYTPENYKIRTMWADDKGVDGLYTLPPVKMTLEESTRRAQIMTDVNSYKNEMILKFITGAEPLSKFDEYVKHVKDLGIDEAIKITQDAYNRFIKN